jgi:hypothetical protein
LIVQQAIMQRITQRGRTLTITKPDVQLSGPPDDCPPAWQIPVQRKTGQRREARFERSNSKAGQAGERPENHE